MKKRKASKKSKAQGRSSGKSASKEPTRGRSSAKRKTVATKHVTRPSSSASKDAGKRVSANRGNARRMPQRYRVADFDVASLPATWERITTVRDRKARDRLALLVHGRERALGAQLQKWRPTNLPEEDFRKLHEVTKDWATESIEQLRNLFFDTINCSDVRIDRYAVERTIMQIVRLGAFLAYSAQQRLRIVHTPVSLDDRNLIIRNVQNEIDSLLTYWVDDFQDWAEPRRWREYGFQPTVELTSPGMPPRVLGREAPVLTVAQYNVVNELIDAGPDGLTKRALVGKSGHTDALGILKRLASSDAAWDEVILFPGTTGKHYRLRFTTSS